MPDNSPFSSERHKSILNTWVHSELRLDYADNVTHRLIADVLVLHLNECLTAEREPDA